MWPVIGRQHLQRSITFFHIQLNVISTRESGGGCVYVCVSSSSSSPIAHTLIFRAFWRDCDEGTINEYSKIKINNNKFNSFRTRLMDGGSKWVWVRFNVFIHFMPIKVFGECKHCNAASMNGANRCTHTHTYRRNGARISARSPSSRSTEWKSNHIRFECAYCLMQAIVRACVRMFQRACVCACTSETHNY